jgi:hypothetical protein
MQLGLTDFDIYSDIPPPTVPKSIRFRRPAFAKREPISNWMVEAWRRRLGGLTIDEARIWRK